MLPPFAYVRPRSLADAVTELARDGSRVHAGGTDLLGCLRERVFPVSRVVSLTGLDGLRGLRPTPDGGLSLGALTTIAEIAESPEVLAGWPALAQAAGEVGSPQLRHQGTLGGNLCQRPRCWYYRGDFPCAKKGGDTCYAWDGENRYHAIFGGGPCFIVHPSDTAPALLALGAAVRLVGPAGERAVPIAEFFQLPADNLEGENVLQPGEVLTEVLLPRRPAGLRSSYRKIRERGSWDFALASVALALQTSGRRILAGRVVLGGVAPVPWRSAAAEAALVGRDLGPAVIREAAAAGAEGAEPLRQNGYKVPLVRGALQASLETLLEEVGG